MPQPNIARAGRCLLAAQGFINVIATNTKKITKIYRRIKVYFSEDDDDGSTTKHETNTNNDQQVKETTLRCSVTLMDSCGDLGMLK